MEPGQRSVTAFLVGFAVGAVSGIYLVADSIHPARNFRSPAQAWLGILSVLLLGVPAVALFPRFTQGLALPLAISTLVSAVVVLFVDGVAFAPPLVLIAVLLLAIYYAGAIVGRRRRGFS